MRSGVGTSTANAESALSSCFGNGCSISAVFGDAILTGDFLREFLFFLISVASGLGVTEELVSEEREWRRCAASSWLVKEEALVDCSSERWVAVVGEVVLERCFRGSVGSVKCPFPSDLAVDADGWMPREVLVLASDSL